MQLLWYPTSHVYGEPLYRDYQRDCHNDGAWYTDGDCFSDRPGGGERPEAAKGGNRTEGKRGGGSEVALERALYLTVKLAPTLAVNALSESLYLISREKYFPISIDSGSCTNMVMGRRG